jgi:hypothetical protein
MREDRVMARIARTEDAMRDWLPLRGKCDITRYVQSRLVCSVSEAERWIDTVLRAYDAPTRTGRFRRWLDANGAY